MSATTFHKPPSSLNESGEERKVGYEFEFTGVEMEEVSRILVSLFNGSSRQLSTFAYEIDTPEFGTFKLELDAQVFLDKKYEKLLRSVGVEMSEFKHIGAIENALKDMASSVVPFEIVTPPIPVSRMDHLNKLVDELRIHRVKGTGSSFIYAFGLHLNPEIPSPSVESLLAHLRAYLLLDSWIRKDADINLSRRITPYINEYQEDYMRLLLNPGYQPDLEVFIRDYFRYGNSRNRPLDLLPVFMHLDENLTSSLIGETLTSARPTYHYRLPNCSLEDPSWTLAKEWNRWVLVETLAANVKELDQYCRAWLRMKSSTLIGFENKWVELMNRWVKHEH
jgi:hypothetical protein